MRRRTLALLVLLPAALRLPGATAGDPVPRTGVGARAGDDPFEWRIFPVAAITHGRLEFGLEKGEVPVPADQVNDEERPLFGSEGEESFKLFGSIDDVIELVKAHESAAFDREGVSIEVYAQGTLGIVVRAPRSTQRAVARYLATLEREVLRTVTLDVVAVRGDARAADEGGFEAALARGVLVPLGGARGPCGVGGWTSARVGSELAYVEDEDVEVAQESSLADPIVSVLKGGLNWRANVADGVGDRVSLAFEGWWAEPGAPDRLTLPKDGEPVERLAATAHRAAGLFDLPVGRWTLVEAGGDVAFAIRPTVREDDGTIPEPPVVGAGMPTTIEGELVARTIDVRDLAASSSSRRGKDRMLLPSNYAPPEPPELREGGPRWPMEWVVDTIRTVDPILAERNDVVLRVEGGFLEVRAPAAHVEAIERFVEAERLRTVRSVRLRGTVVALPLASVPEYLAGLDDGATLVADGGASLLSRPGARVVDRASVRFTGSDRVASDGGCLHRYVGDYDAEIALGARIGKPIVKDVLEGLRFEIDAAYAAEPSALYAELFIDRATWRGSRMVPTPNGEIECPTLDVSRIRGGSLVRAGSPRIVGATLENGVVTLTIVGATLE